MYKMAIYQHKEFLDYHPREFKTKKLAKKVAWYYADAHRHQGVMTKVVWVDK